MSAVKKMYEYYDKGTFRFAKRLKKDGATFNLA